jgi:alanine racemase
MPRPTIAEIDLASLRYNLRSCREFIGPNLKFMAVVKANAYGHGAIECSQALEKEGVDWFGVATVDEAVELRAAGIQTPILCLGSFFEGEESSLLERDIASVVFRIDQAKSLSEAARKSNRVTNIHIKIDTGFGRIGVRWDAVAGFIKQLKTLENVNVQGLMTHFAAADEPEQNDFTDEQIRRFYDAAETFRKAGFEPSLIDLANSPGAVGHPNSRGNMVRLGGVLYGLAGDILPLRISKPDLRPVMSVKSKVAMLKRVPKGESLGYGRTFFTTRDSIIATVPIGYHDGYRRGLSNKARALVGGNYVPVVGRMSMDWTILDVTDVPNVEVDDEVVFIGHQGDLEIRAEELAQKLDTISYEVTCGISARVRRLYIDRE